MAHTDLIIGYILGGGEGRRMGGVPKGFLEVGGSSLLTRVVERLRPQVSRLVINSNLPPGRFSAFGADVLADLQPGLGPLGGLLSCFDHAAALVPAPSHVLTVPWDCPFLPPDLAERLSAADADAAIAESAGRGHPLTGLWRVELRAHLRHAVEEEDLRAARDWAARAHARPIPFAAEPVDPFFNINTGDDLARADKLARQYWL